MPLSMPGTYRSRPVFRSLAILLGLAALAGCLAVPMTARTRKGDKFLAQGKEREVRKDWDGALDFYNKALAEDPTDPGYQLEVHQARFQASQAHVSQGLKARKEGSLGQALVEFQKAYGTRASIGRVPEGVWHRPLFERGRARDQDHHPDDRAGEKKRRGFGHPEPDAVPTG